MSTTTSSSPTAMAIPDINLVAPLDAPLNVSDGNPITRPQADDELESETDPQILEALKSPKDRLYVLKLGETMEGLILERNTRTRAETLPQSTYQRLLVHRCAAYYKLQPEPDNQTKSIWVSVTIESRIPPRRLAELVPPEASPLPTFKIMRRAAPDRKSKTPTQTGSNEDNLSDEPVDGSEPISSGKGFTVPPKKRMTIAEREAAYKEARSRIFMDFEEKEKESHMSASSSTLSLNSGTNGGSGSLSVDGDAASTAPTESDYSSPPVAKSGKDSRRNSNVPSRSTPLRSSAPPFVGPQNGHPPPPFAYPSLYEPPPSGYDAQPPPPPNHAVPPPNYPVMYPPYHPPFGSPNYNQPYPFYPGYPYPPQPPSASSPSPPSDQYLPPHPYSQQQFWPSPPQPMGPPQHPQRPNGQLPLPQGQARHPTSPPVPPPQEFVPYPQHPPYMYPGQPGPYYPPHPGQPPVPDPRNGVPNGNGSNLGGIGNPNSNHSSGASSRSQSRSSGRDSGDFGRRRPQQGPAWSYGPGISIGGVHVNGHAPDGMGIRILPPVNVPMNDRKKSSGTSHTGSSSSGASAGTRTPADETASTTSSSASSSSSRRTFTSASSQHPLPARPDWAINLKPQSSTNLHQQIGAGRRLSQSQQQQQQQLPAANDFPPLTPMATPEKRNPAPGGAWTNSSSTRSILTPNSNATITTGNPPVAPHARILDDDRTFERPPPRGTTELYNPRSSAPRRNNTATSTSSTGTPAATSPSPAAIPTTPTPSAAVVDGDRVGKENERERVVAQAILIDGMGSLGIQDGAERQNSNVTAHGSLPGTIVGVGD